MGIFVLTKPVINQSICSSIWASTHQRCHIGFFKAEQSATSRVILFFLESLYICSFYQQGYKDIFCDNVTTSKIKFLAVVAHALDG